MSEYLYIPTYYNQMLEMSIPSLAQTCILMVIICTCICGCIGLAPQSEAAHSSGGGIVDIGVPLLPQKYDLDEALAELDMSIAEGIVCNYTDDFSIHRVMGALVDADGRAASWLIGGRSEDASVWLAYGRSGWNKISLDVPVSGGQIEIEAITPPTELFERHQTLIRDAMARHGTVTVDLALTNSTYEITFRSMSGGIEVLTFSALSGEVLP
jgi:hypothetical protein